MKKEQVIVLGVGIIILICGTFVGLTYTRNTTITTTQTVTLAETVTESTTLTMPSLIAASPFAVIPLNSLNETSYTAGIGTCCVGVIQEGVNYTYHGANVNVAYAEGWLGIQVSVPKNENVLVIVTNCTMYRMQGSESSNPGQRVSYVGTFMKLNSLDSQWDGFRPTSQSVVYLYLLQP